MADNSEDARKREEQERQEQRLQNLERQLNHYNRALGGLELYTKMQSNYTPELRVTSFAEKIAILLIVAGQAAHYALDDDVTCLGKEVPSDVRSRVEKLHSRIDQCVNDLADDLKQTVLDFGELNKSKTG